MFTQKLLNLVQKNKELNYNIFVILISVTAVFLILYNTSKYGAGLTPDSLCYITTAEKIQENLLVFFSDYSSLSIWPPVYPIVLAVFSSITFNEPLNSAHYLNAIFIFLFFLSAGKILNHISQLKIISIMLLITMLLLNKIPLVFIQAWSEPPFLLLINLFLLFFLKYHKKSNNKIFIILSFIALLLSLTRYIGVAFFIPIIYLAIKENEKRKKILIAFLVGILPFILYILRNFIYTNSLFGFDNTIIGGKRAPIFSLFERFRAIISEIYTWILPFKEFDVNQKSIIVLFFIIYILLFVYLFFYYEKKSKIGLSNLKTMFFFNFLILTCATYFLLLYFLVGYEKINYRNITPILPTCLFIIAIFLNAKYQSKESDKLGASIFLFCIFFIISFNLFFNAKTQFNESKSRHKYGAGGYNSAEFRDSKLLKFILNGEIADSLIYSCNAWEIKVISKYRIKGFPQKKNDILKDITKYDSVFIALFSFRESKRDYRLKDLLDIYEIDTIFHHKKDILFYTKSIKKDSICQDSL